MAQSAFRLVIILVLARLLTPEDFGTFATLAPLTELAILFRSLGLTTVIVQAPTLSQSLLDALLTIQLTVAISLGVLLAGGAYFWAQFLGSPEITLLAVAMAGVVVIGSFGAVHDGLLRRKLLFRRIAVVNVIGVLLGFAAALAGVLAGLGVWALILQAFGHSLATSLGYWWACSWRPKRFRISEGVGDALRLGGVLTSAQLFDYFRKNADRIIIRTAEGTIVLGLYDRAYRFLLFPITSTTQPIVRTLLPWLCRMKGTAEYETVFLRFLRLALYAVGPMVCCFVVFPEAVIRIGLGAQWLEATSILQGLSLAALVLPIVSLTSTHLIVYGRKRSIFWLSATVSLLSIASFLIGIRFGATGVAWAYGITTVLWMPFAMFWYLRGTPVRYLATIGTVLKIYLIGAGVGVAAVFALQGWPAMIQIGALVCTYVLVMLKLTPLWKDVTYLANLYRTT